MVRRGEHVAEAAAVTPRGNELSAHALVVAAHTAGTEMREGEIDHVRRAAGIERLEAYIAAVEVETGDVGGTAGKVPGVEDEEVFIQRDNPTRQRSARRPTVPVDDPPEPTTTSRDPGVAGNDPLRVHRIEFLQCALELCGACATIGEHVLVAENGISRGRAATEAVDRRIGLVIAVGQ